MYPSLYLISTVLCEQRVGPRSTQGHTENHPIQVHAEIQLHRECTYLLSPGVWSSVLSFGPPLPYPKRHFCNSMQASELCQKVLASLKADLSFKVSASLMGSTSPSAGTRNESSFTCMCERSVLRRFDETTQPVHEGQGQERFHNMILISYHCGHHQLANSYFVGLEVSQCLKSLLARPL